MHWSSLFLGASYAHTRSTDDVNWGGGIICKGVSERIITCLLVSLSIGITSSARAQEGVGTLSSRVFDDWPPPHRNHTFPNISSQVDGIGLELLSIGDIVGEREVIPG